MWHQIIAWPGWDNVFKLAGFFASIAAIFGVPILIYQVILARNAFINEQTEREERRDKERADEERRLNSYRTTILTALRTEVDAIYTAAEVDLKRFYPSDLSNPRVKSAYEDQQIEGEMGYRRSFIWTQLPHNTIEQAIHEAALLSLTSEQIQALQDLRLSILRGNALVAGKIAVLPTLLQGKIQREFQLSYDRWIDMKSDNLDRNIMIEFNNIMNSCNKIRGWLQ